MNLHEWVQEEVVSDGVIRVNKPLGIPSTALTELYKRAMQQKVGHGGTLDPLATGDMVLGIGKGTKQLQNYLTGTKVYNTTILFGAYSESGDVELPISLTGQPALVEKDPLMIMLERFSEGYTQQVPTLSAKKIQGKAAYDMVRAGQELEAALTSETKLLAWDLKDYMVGSAEAVSTQLQKMADEMTEQFSLFKEIGQSLGYRTEKYESLLVKWKANLAQSLQTLQKQTKEPQFTFFTVEVAVPKGTYIRALAEDLAREFGTRGLVINLHRLVG